MSPYLIVVIIIIILGLFGGIINYFLLNRPIDDGSNRAQVQNDDIKNGPAFNHFLFWKSLSMGVAASILVPLFLNTISSSVLLDILSAKSVDKNHFIFAGFCLIAAIASKRFIEDLYDKVIKIGKTANEAKTKAEEATGKVEAVSLETRELVHANTEPEELEERQSPNKSLVKGKKEDKLIDNDRKVIDAFGKSKYIYRTLKGIANDSGLTGQETMDILDGLENRHIVKSKLNSSAQKIWRVLSE